MTGNINTFRQGATAFRNARDWAQEQRDTFISAANERARSANVAPLPSESSDHNYISDPTNEEDASYLVAGEGLVDDGFLYDQQPIVSDKNVRYTYLSP